MGQISRGLVDFIQKLLFVEQGETVDANYYKKMLKKHLRVIRRLSGRRKFKIQQDGARCHTANPVLDYFNQHVPHYIEKEDWPANSCDLNLLDYAI